MEGYTFVQYCVYIKNGDKYYSFVKENIINNSGGYQPCHVPISNKHIYDIFFILYPVLKEIPIELIEIRKSWSSWCPLNPNEKIPKNNYNKAHDEFVTRSYTKWRDTEKPVGIYKCETKKDNENMISDWLEEHGDPEIERKIENEMAYKFYNDNCESNSDTSHGDLVPLIWMIEKLRKREGGCIMNELVAELKKNFKGLENIQNK